MIGFLSGELGDPPGGWPEPFRTKALVGRTVKPVETELSAEDAEALESEPRRTLNRLLFPGPTRDYGDAVDEFSELSVLSTREFLHGLAVHRPGRVGARQKLLLGLEAIGEPDARGYRQVVCTINGQIRVVSVRDHAIKSEVALAEKAVPAIRGMWRHRSRVWSP